MDAINDDLLSTLKQRAPDLYEEWFANHGIPLPVVMKSVANEVCRAAKLPCDAEGEKMIAMLLDSFLFNVIGMSRDNFQGREKMPVSDFALPLLVASLVKTFIDTAGITGDKAAILQLIDKIYAGLKDVYE